MNSGDEAVKEIWTARARLSKAVTGTTSAGGQPVDVASTAMSCPKSSPTCWVKLDHRHERGTRADAS